MPRLFYFGTIASVVCTRGEFESYAKRLSKLAYQVDHRIGAMAINRSNETQFIFEELGVSSTVSTLSMCIEGLSNRMSEMN